MTDGLDGLLRGKACPLADPRGKTTHWTLATMVA